MPKRDFQIHLRSTKKEDAALPTLFPGSPFWQITPANCTIVGMDIVADTSAILAVITNSPEKDSLAEITRNSSLVAPASVHWEIGNAFSSLLKRRLINLTEVAEALQAYEAIPIRFLDVDLERAIQIAAELTIYAYDAYLIVCSQQARAPLLTLDRGLARSARRVGVTILEVP
jgi:predicted nucleic acid-binding protein